MHHPYDDDEGTLVSEKIPFPFQSLFKFERFNPMQSVVLDQALSGDVSCN